MWGWFPSNIIVIPKETRANIVEASLKYSYLWTYFSIYELKENMRLSGGKIKGYEANEIESFGNWLLKIGDGSVDAENNKDLIYVPPDVYIEPSHNQIEVIPIEE